MYEYEYFLKNSQKLKLHVLLLKVLSSEMDLAKSGLFRKVLIQKRFSANFSRPQPVRAL